MDRDSNSLLNLPLQTIQDAPKSYRDSRAGLEIQPNMPDNAITSQSQAQPNEYEKNDSAISIEVVIIISVILLLISTFVWSKIKKRNNRNKPKSINY